MANPPIPFSGVRSSQFGSPSDPTVGISLMGWNQLVIIRSTGPNANEYLETIFGTGNPLRVADYSVGITQTGNVPDYVTGRQDHTAWMKGPIESGGTLSYPFTFRTGAAMLFAGANLVFNPAQSFEIFASANPVLRGCKVKSVSISCNSKEEVKIESEVWGIADEIDPAFDSFPVIKRQEQQLLVLVIQTVLQQQIIALLILNKFQCGMLFKLSVRQQECILSDSSLQ